jgi:hypothetical protein
MEILDTTIATASLRHLAVGGAVAVGLGLFARKAASLEAMTGQFYRTSSQRVRFHGFWFYFSL